MKILKKGKFKELSHKERFNISKFYEAQGECSRCGTIIECDEKDDPIAFIDGPNSESKYFLRCQTKSCDGDIWLKLKYPKREIK